MGRAIRIGQLGCGIVGSAVLRMLARNATDIEQRLGASIEVVAVAVRHLAKERDVPPGTEALYTTDPHEIVGHPDVDIVVEAIGGIEPARHLLLEAINNGKHVVTANKELLAALGQELYEAAERKGVDLYFEAAVAGGIPLIHPLRESLAGERVTKVMGIVNGTTNFILTRMAEEGLEFGEALAEAERLGYTELDPTADIEGFDPAAKAAILASIAFNARVVSGDVYREGIADITAQDIAFARRLGYTVKLLAIAEQQDGEIAVRVHPAMIPNEHPLASVRENFNAVFVEGDSVGELMFYGRGAQPPRSHQDHKRHARRRRRDVSSVAPHLWRGIITEYRDRLPVSDTTPVVTLCEGGTPLIHSERLSEQLGADIYLKYEGAN